VRTAPQGETARRGRPHSQMRKVGLVAKVMIAFDCSHFLLGRGGMEQSRTPYGCQNMRPQRPAVCPPGGLETSRL
jgi:hypothetical protein